MSAVNMVQDFIQWIGSTKGERAPFLFVSQDIETLHAQIYQSLISEMKDYGVDIQSLFHLETTEESIKIWEIKKFFTHIEVKPRFAFQVFFIEDISRMTLQAQNACLKVLEEPGEGNIIILSARSEAGILDTILSRVQCVKLMQSSFLERSENRDSFYTGMIESHVSWRSDELVRYFFSGKFEKQEYAKFFKELLAYFMNNPIYKSIIDELEEDISGVLNNNLQGRYIVDKWIMRL